MYFIDWIKMKMVMMMMMMMIIIIIIIIITRTISFQLASVLHEKMIV